MILPIKELTHGCILLQVMQQRQQLCYFYISVHVASPATQCQKCINSFQVKLYTIKMVIKTFSNNHVYLLCR